MEYLRDKAFALMSESISFLRSYKVYEEINIIIFFYCVVPVYAVETNPTNKGFKNRSSPF